MMIQKPNMLYLWRFFNLYIFLSNNLMVTFGLCFLSMYLLNVMQKSYQQHKK